MQGDTAVISSDIDQPITRQALRIDAASMGRYLPAEPGDGPMQAPAQDVFMQRFTHHTVTEPITVPAVVEPLLVLVVAGAATVEERLPGGAWEAAQVKAGDFYLTHSSMPYEMRWQTLHGDSFEVVHLYLGLQLIEEAVQEVLGKPGDAVRFRDVSGARDERVRCLLEPLCDELSARHPPSQLYVRGLAQALAVHLVRTYADALDNGRRSNALQAYKLRQVIDVMNARLGEAFSLPQLAQVAGLSVYHFSRLFKRATGLSPSQYFIRLRMARARQLLTETARSIIDIGLEVGYSSPSHFSQVFRREVGVAPSAYRQT